MAQFHGNEFRWKTSLIPGTITRYFLYRDTNDFIHAELETVKYVVINKHMIYNKMQQKITRSSQ